MNKDDFQKIKNFLMHFRECGIKEHTHTQEEFLKLTDGQVYWPQEYCIQLELKKGFLSSIPYFNYDPTLKTTIGVNPDLIKAVTYFFKETKNEKFIRPMEKFFW